MKYLSPESGDTRNTLLTCREYKSNLIDTDSNFQGKFMKGTRTEIIFACMDTRKRLLMKCL